MLHAEPTGIEDEGPPPFRVTLRQAKAKWPEWEAFQEQRRTDGYQAAMDKYGSPDVAELLVEVHLPKLPPPTEVVAHALELECGHEEFWLVKKANEPSSPPERMRCPTFVNCQLNDGHAAVRYLAPGQPEPEYADMGLARWQVKLDCGHDKQVLRREPDGPAASELVKCLTCRPADTQDRARIVAVDARLPDQMLQHWSVELDCGHTGTDHYIPVEHADDPAAYRAAHPREVGLRCISRECDERRVIGVRRLGVIGKVQAPKKPPVDPVTAVAKEIRYRLTPAERQELIRRLEQGQ